MQKALTRGDGGPCAQVVATDHHHDGQDHDDHDDQGQAAAARRPTTTSTHDHRSSDIPKTTADKVSITTVGPTWGSSITNKAIEALIIFFIVVAIYISIRFEPKMALAAFIAMIHDVLVAIGIYSIFNFQVTPDTVVAILTILGYSLYDTVVVFDRVRDNTKGIGSSGRMTYPQLINLSMNQTLARSINTSAVAILPVLAVLLIGAQLLGATTLQSYGLALFVGLLSGAYSSIFIASPVLCMMKEREDRWVAIESRLAKRGETGAWYSAADAAALSTQISVAAAGQVGRVGGGGGAAAAQRSGGSKRSGPIRPGSGSRSGRGSGSGAGTGTAVMDRPAGGADSAASGGGSSGGRRQRQQRAARVVAASGGSGGEPGTGSGRPGATASGPRAPATQEQGQATPLTRNNQRQWRCRHCSRQVPWINGGPDPGDAHQRRRRDDERPARGRAGARARPGGAEERTLDELLAPLLAEFARHRPDEDTATDRRGGADGAAGPRGPVPALG